MVTLRYLLYAAGVVTVLALLATVVPFLIALWAAVQIGVIVMGLGMLVGYAFARKHRKK